MKTSSTSSVKPTSTWPFPTVTPPTTVVQQLRTKLNAVQTKPITGAQAAVKAAKRKPTNHRAAWDAAADNQLIMGFMAGQTPAALAKTCGRTKASVAGRLHALGMLVFDKDTLTYSTAPKLWFKVPVVKS